MVLRTASHESRLVEKRFSFYPSTSLRSFAALDWLLVIRRL